MKDLSYLNYIEKANLRMSAEEKRANLVAQNLSTYRLEISQERKTIVCLCCGLRAVDIEDIEQKYCEFCCANHSS